MENPCIICGIDTVSVINGVIHAEPRTLENNLHNNTPDHNAQVN